MSKKNLASPRSLEDAILAFLDPLDLVEVRRDEEEVVNVEGNAVRVFSPAADVDAERPIEFEDLADVFATVDIMYNSSSSAPWRYTLSILASWA